MSLRKGRNGQLFHVIDLVEKYTERLLEAMGRVIKKLKANKNSNNNKKQGNYYFGEKQKVK